MVSPLTIVFLILTGIVSLALPIVVLIYVRQKWGVSWRAMIVGVLVFIVFSQVLEKALHVYVLMINDTTAEWLKNPYWYALYGGLAAALFEEFGRLVGFRYFLKNQRTFTDGLSYGIGHGGIEAWLVGALATVQFTAFAILINTGGFAPLVASAGPGASQLLAVKDQLLHTSPFTALLGAFERIFAFTLQLALSLLVLKAVRTRRKVYFAAAVLIHAAVDFIAALGQKLSFSLWLIEGFLFIVAVVAALWINSEKTS
ncbi:MAG TPA: YhfC family intramembrane metalloprotease [Bacillales bacterium]|nr:YhfC family intramembrane metalloprotease [Bacillales bacterium]